LREAVGKEKEMTKKKFTQRVAKKLRNSVGIEFVSSQKIARELIKEELDVYNIEDKVDRVKEIFGSSGKKYTFELIWVRGIYDDGGYPVYRNDLKINGVRLLPLVDEYGDIEERWYEETDF
jgi:hypothetical protein